MNCGITGAEWTDYLDGALPARRRREMEAHLRECAGCRSEADTLRETDQCLRIECGLFGCSTAPESQQSAAQERILAALRAAAAIGKPPEVHERLWRVRWVLAMLCGPNTAGRIIEAARDAARDAARKDAGAGGSVSTEQSWLLFLRRLSFLTTEICGCHAGDLILAVGK